MPYYVKVDSSAIKESKSKIKLLIEEGLNNKIISQEEYEAMKPDDKNPSTFYCTFKIHKTHEEGSAPLKGPL